MKIAIDGGGYCADPKRRFGNYIFTKNLTSSLIAYDLKNSYYIYSFCNIPEFLKLPTRWNYNVLQPARLWMKARVSVEEFLFKKDIFLAFNQAVPLYSNAKIISFSHGLSYYYFPHFYRESYIRLTMQLTPMILRSKYIVVSSKKVKDEMKEAYPDYKNVVVIPFGVPEDMVNLTNNRIKKKPYFIYSGMNHPIKNIKFLLKAFKKFRSDPAYKKYSLILVGVERIKSDNKKGIEVIESTTRQQLKKLYQEATAYVTASLYESFNLPVLESLSQNTPVIGLQSAIIPELESYVEIAHTIDEFVEKMKDITKSNISIDCHIIQKLFSWKTYVNKLIKLY